MGCHSLIMDRRIRTVVQVIEQNLRLPMRVDDLARHVGLGVSRLEHLFKEQTRTSIREFVLERRLTTAALLLVETEERVSVISFRVGYQHASNFNHAFKKWFGVSPRQYRENRAEEKAEATK